MNKARSAIKRLSFGLIPRNPYPHSLRDIVTAFFSKHNHDEVLARCIEVTGRNTGFFTNSGRHGLYLVFATLLKKGDEVILPAFTCNALVGPLIKSGLLPVFADISLDTLNSEIEQISPLVTEKTKAVIMTHQMGYPTNADAIVEFCRKRNLLLIEDAAPAFGGELRGKKIGSFGDVAICSFQRTKVISAIEGGLVVGDDAYIRKIMSKLSVDTKSSSINFAITALVQYLSFSRYSYPFILLMWRVFKGRSSTAHEWIPDTHKYALTYNGLSTFQIGLLAIGLEELESILGNRRIAAKMFTEAIRRSGTGWTVPQEVVADVKCSTYARFTVLIGASSENKFAIQREFQKYGIDLGFTFSYSLCSFFKDARRGSLANTERVVARILNIPIHPNHNVNVEIVDSLIKALSQYKQKEKNELS